MQNYVISILLMDLRMDIYKREIVMLGAQLCLSKQ